MILFLSLNAIFKRFGILPNQRILPFILKFLSLKSESYFSKKFLINYLFLLLLQLLLLSILLVFLQLHQSFLQQVMMVLSLPRALDNLVKMPLKLQKY